MYTAVIKLAYRLEREKTPGAVLIPGRKTGVWIAGGLGFLVVLLGIVLSFIPPGETENKLLFEVKLASGTALAVLFGIWLYSRGVRVRSRQRESVGSRPTRG